MHEEGAVTFRQRVLPKSFALPAKMLNKKDVESFAVKKLKNWKVEKQKVQKFRSDHLQFEEVTAVVHFQRHLHHTI